MSETTTEQPVADEAQATADEQGNPDVDSLGDERFEYAQDGWFGRGGDESRDAPPLFFRNQGGERNSERGLGDIEFIRAAGGSRQSHKLTQFGFHIADRHVPILFRHSRANLES